MGPLDVQADFERPARVRLWVPGRAGLADLREAAVRGRARGQTELAAEDCEIRFGRGSS